MFGRMGVSTVIVAICIWGVLYQLHVCQLVLLYCSRCQEFRWRILLALRHRCSLLAFLVHGVARACIRVRLYSLVAILISRQMLRPQGTCTILDRMRLWCKLSGAPSCFLCNNDSGDFHLDVSDLQDQPSVWHTKCGWRFSFSNYSRYCSIPDTTWWGDLCEKCLPDERSARRQWLDSSMSE